MIPGHVCNVYCSGDEHCELVWSGFDHLPGDSPLGPFEGIRRHYDAEYRRHYRARVARCEPAREAPPRETVAPEEITPLRGRPGADVYPWLVWFVPPGSAAAAFAAAEEAAWQARLAAVRGGPS